MNEVGEVASVVEDQVESFPSREGGKGLFDAPGVFFLGLAFPSVDRHAGCSNPAIISDKISLTLSRCQVYNDILRTLRQHGLGLRRCSNEWNVV